MREALKVKYERDREVWDACAETYEDQIVGGHPDIAAYEEFEEDFLDRLLIYLVRDRKQRVHLFDVGCGSARLHLRYGLKTTSADRLPAGDAKCVRQAREACPAYCYDPKLAAGLVSIGGIDFSAEMIGLAEAKLREAGLGSRLEDGMSLEVGSAFAMQPFTVDAVPVVVAVCNTIGVMQGPAGASELFQAMSRALDERDGIAIISCYRKEAVTAFALGNYESTMDVCGQPRWLEPKTYAGEEFTQVPRHYKRAHDVDPEVRVDVHDADGRVVERNHTLVRSPAKVLELAESGHIETHTDYESFWYGFNRIQSWMDEHWTVGQTHHFRGRELDALRAEPAQLAILDRTGLLSGYFERISSE